MYTAAILDFEFGVDEKLWVLTTIWKSNFMKYLCFFLIVRSFEIQAYRHSSKNCVAFFVDLLEMMMHKLHYY